MARLAGTSLAIALLQAIFALNPAAAFTPPCTFPGSALTVGIPNKGSTACWRQGLERSATRNGVPPLMSEGGGVSIKAVDRVKMQDMDREVRSDRPPLSLGEDPPTNEILVEQPPPQGVFVCGRAGLVMNKFSKL